MMIVILVMIKIYHFKNSSLCSSKSIHVIKHQRSIIFTQFKFMSMSAADVMIETVSPKLDSLVIARSVL